MTREESIEVIKQDIPCEHDADLIEALEMAIQALEQEPTDEYMCGYNKGFDEGVEEGIKATVEPCEDAVSREACLMCLTGEFVPDKEYKPEELIAVFSKRIKALPPVTVRQTGEWILKQQGDRYADYYCSECGNELNLAYCTIKDEQKKGRCLYCDHCGAEME